MATRPRDGVNDGKSDRRGARATSMRGRSETKYDCGTGTYRGSYCAEERLNTRRMPKQCGESPPAKRGGRAALPLQATGVTTQAPAQLYTNEFPDQVVSRPGYPA